MGLLLTAKACVASDVGEHYCSLCEYQDATAANDIRALLQSLQNGSDRSPTWSRASENSSVWAREHSSMPKGPAGGGPKGRSLLLYSAYVGDGSHPRDFSESSNQHRDCDDSWHCVPCAAS